MASIAQTTNMLIETGCKHIIPVRISYDTMVTLSCDTSMETGEKFMRDKYKYCAHKNDMLLCVSRNLLREGEGSIAGKQAYPPVVSNLGDIDIATKALICQIYAVANENGPENAYADFMLQAEYPPPVLVAGAPPAPPTQMQELLGPFVRKYKDRRMLKLPFFTFMGYSCGLGYVHPSNGDTVVSSFIGGLITVRNGAFPIKAGDTVQWYFDFEGGYFFKSGHRIPAANAQNRAVSIFPFIGVQPNGHTHGLADEEGQRMEAWHRENGIIGPHGAGMPVKTDGHGMKNNMFLPKPYFRHPTLDYYLDRTRVFAKALGNARPFDMVDLQICTQSI